MDICYIFLVDITFKKCFDICHYIETQILVIETDAKNGLAQILLLLKNPQFLAKPYESRLNGQILRKFNFFASVFSGFFYPL